MNNIEVPSWATAHAELQDAIKNQDAANAETPPDPGRLKRSFEIVKQKIDAERAAAIRAQMEAAVVATYGVGMKYAEKNV